MPAKKTTKTTSKGIKKQAALKAQVNSYTWQAPEYEHHEKGALWFLGFGLVITIVMLYAFIVGNWLLMAVLALLVVVIFKLAKRPPHVLNHIINNHGVYVGHRFLPYANLKTFWITRGNHHISHLNLEGTKRILPHFKFQLGSADEYKIKEILVAHLPEAPERREDFADRLARFLKI